MSSIRAAGGEHDGISGVKEKMTERLRCFVVSRSGADAPAELLDGLRPYAEVITGSTPQEFAQVAETIDAIFTSGGGNPRFLLEPLGEIPERLRWIAHAGIGVDQFLFPRLVESKITVTNMRGVSSYAEAMAEFAFAAIMLFGKKLLEVERNRERRTWQRVQHSLLRDQTVGVIGLGTIGREIARRAHAFGMTVFATKRHPESASMEGVTILPPEELDTLLQQSNYVVIAAPRTGETHGLIGAHEIQQMKPGAVLVNIARGGMIDESALLAALETGMLGGAALDVFSEEPLPAESPLWTAPNLFLSPHMSAFVELVPGPIVDAMIDNMQRFQRGEPLLRVVDKQRGY